MSGPSPTAARMQRVLSERFRPTHLEVRDESAAHAGHASAGGRGHFRVRIVSVSFSGLKSLQRHRLVNEALAPLFESAVHAVAIETLTPEEFIK